MTIKFIVYYLHCYFLFMKMVTTRVQIILNMTRVHYHVILANNNGKIEHTQQYLGFSQHRLEKDFM